VRLVVAEVLLFVLMCGFGGIQDDARRRQPEHVNETLEAIKAQHDCVQGH
jgi:hypothetical protein